MLHIWHFEKKYGCAHHATWWARSPTQPPCWPPDSYCITLLHCWTPSPPRAAQRSGSSQGPVLLQSLPGGGISVQAPKQQVAVLQAAVMGSLAAWGLAGALLEAPDAQAADTAGLQLALAAAFCVYSLKENKRVPFGGRG